MKRKNKKIFLIETMHNKKNYMNVFLDLRVKSNETHYNLELNLRIKLFSYEPNNDSKKVFLKNLKDRAPELFKTLHESEEDTWRVPAAYSTPAKPPRNGYDVYEPPTRLRDTTPTTNSHVIRRGSNSSDYSESYHTTSRNDDPIRPSVTDTYQSFSKKTVPSRDGRFVYSHFGVFM